MTGLQIGALLFLVWNSIKDIRMKKISFVSVVVFFAFRLLYFTFNFVKVQEDLLSEIGTIMLGLLPGLMLCIITKISRGELGYGDGIVTMVAGLYIGFKLTATMIMWAFFLAFFWSVGLLVIRRYKPESQFPFVPFLFIGLLLSLWL